MRGIALAFAATLATLASLGCNRRAEESPRPAPVSLPPAPAAPRAAPEQAFVCADGFPFLVRIEGETAYVTLPERSVALPLMPAASGAKYDDGEVVFWSHGPAAMLSADGELHRDCQP